MDPLLLGSNPKLSSFPFSSCFTSGGSSRRSGDFKVRHFPSSIGEIEASCCTPVNILEGHCTVRVQQHRLKHPIGSIVKRFTINHGSDTKFSVHAASGQPFESDPGAYDPKRTVLSSLHAFYKFSRPHTVIGTALSIISVSLLAVKKLSDFSPLFFTGLLEVIPEHVKSFERAH
uniref:Homogentisate phytyltransferase n=1 Tax=Rhizophora mucronata TaxID=61149 RepID=A0A2P2L3L4_RHIMU